MVRGFSIGGEFFDFGSPAVMGIVNLTPDSFFDGGRWDDPSVALRHIETLINDGADIIDIGAESTRPGADPVDAQEEIQRLSAVIKSYKKHFSTPLSLDTNKAIVADFGLRNGVDMINDVYGLKKDQYMARTVARFQKPVVVMHTQGEAKTMQENPRYDDVVTDVIEGLQQSIQIAKEAGINDIICDCGIGFGKTVQHNLTLINQLNKLSVLDCPLLIGTSNKSFISKVMNDDSHQKLEGSLVSGLMAVLNGASLLRVHDVKATRKALKMLLAIQSEGVRVEVPV